MARSSSVGSTFSMPVTATCTRGITVHMPSLPSFVTSATEPVSAITKLPPVTPMSADMKCGRSTSRASRVMSGISVRRGLPCVFAKRSAISFLILVDDRRDDVARRLVVVDLQDVFAEIGFDGLHAHLAEHVVQAAFPRSTIDFVLITFFTSCLRAMSRDEPRRVLRRSPRRAPSRRAGSPRARRFPATRRDFRARDCDAPSARRASPRSRSRVIARRAGADELGRQLGQVLLQALVGEFADRRAP